MGGCWLCLTKPRKEERTLGTYVNLPSDNALMTVRVTSQGDRTTLCNTLKCGSTDRFERKELGFGWDWVDQQTHFTQLFDRYDCPTTGSTDRALVGGVEKHRCATPFPSGCLATEPVQGPASLLQREHNVKSSHSLAAAMLSVGHSILDQVLQEELQHRAGLLIDGTGDTLHTTTTRQAADGGL